MQILYTQKHFRDLKKFLISKQIKSIELHRCERNMRQYFNLRQYLNFVILQRTNARENIRKLHSD